MQPGRCVRIRSGEPPSSPRRSTCDATHTEVPAQETAFMETRAQVTDDCAYMDLYDARLGRTHCADCRQRDFIRDK
eukprot:7030268-Pyramimonas_sp.AAC.1